MVSEVTTARMTVPKTLPREMQVKLVMKLLERNGEHSANQIRRRAAKGEGVTAKGVEFNVSILIEALATWDARLSDASKTTGKSGAALAESPSKKRNKRKSGGTDDKQDPVNASTQKAARHSARKPAVAESVDENKPAASAAPAFISASGKAVFGASGRPEAGTSEVKKDTAYRNHLPGVSRAAKDPPGPTKAEPPASSTSPAADAEGSSVKELKSMLAAQGIDCAGCVEKAELHALLARFEMWRQRPLSELQDSCQVEGGSRFETVDECARYLVSGTPGVCKGRVACSAQAAEASVPKEQDAQREVNRILPLRKTSFRTPMLWAFSVLEVPSNTRDVSTVQRAYRSMMRKLHPDRAGQDAQVAKAVELVREAKEACERALSRQEPPLAPRRVWSETLSSVPGRRQFKLHWTAPEERPSAPIRRYVVAAFDPAYGRALTIAMLEPDYSEESRSFVSIDRLTSFIFSEEDLQKMPKLWKQTHATVQLAAANEAGQSPWVSLQVPLSGPAAKQSASPTASANANPSNEPRPEDLDVRAWDVQVRKLRGAQLREWLEPQKKNILAAWLKFMNWSAQGSKYDILERVIFIREAMPS
eukprot:TRINITY_DN105198_c0_g1_i1.p1 TRINITY_DN105198_c0_g1~~TRINITY_DN105198_c0_g1_i1.p1  ORF type:complete len:601 (+),score=95.70 TRINITY_DN105198_c0_g1_i1:28-1803(+)